MKITMSFKGRAWETSRKELEKRILENFKMDPSWRSTRAQHSRIKMRIQLRHMDWVKGYLSSRMPHLLRKSTIRGWDKPIQWVTTSVRELWMFRSTLCIGEAKWDHPRALSILQRLELRCLPQRQNSRPRNIASYSNWSRTSWHILL